MLRRRTDGREGVRIKREIGVLASARDIFDLAHRFRDGAKLRARFPALLELTRMALEDVVECEAHSCYLVSGRRHPFRP